MHFKLSTFYCQFKEVHIGKNRGAFVPESFPSFNP